MHAREAGVLQGYGPVWGQKSTFLSCCHTQECNRTGILPITEWDLILTDGADELRCAAGFFYSSSAEIEEKKTKQKDILLGFLCNHDLSFFSYSSSWLIVPRICPGLRLRLLKRSRWLISAFERHVHGVNSVFFGLICFGGVFLFCLPAIIDAPTLCSRGSTGFKREAHRRFVLRSQQDQIQVENSRHLCFPYKPPNKTEALVLRV